jgi:hypothetical protein
MDCGILVVIMSCSLVDGYKHSSTTSVETTIHISTTEKIPNIKNTFRFEILSPLIICNTSLQPSPVETQKDPKCSKFCLILWNQCTFIIFNLGNVSTNKKNCRFYRKEEEKVLKTANG